MRRRRILWFAPLAIIGMAVFIAIGGEIVRLLWNWLAPALFGWHQISFWQAIGLLLLCRILFGGLGMRGGSRSAARERIRQRMAERWEHMTPEEREKFRQSWRGRWCAPPEEKAPSA